MNNNKTNYTDLIKSANSLLNLSLQKIKEDYRSFPICLIEYQEKDIHRKSIEIRLDKDDLTITCLFDSDDICRWVYLFTDKKETTESIISFLKDSYTFDYNKNRWIIPRSYVRIKGLNNLGTESCLCFHE